MQSIVLNRWLQGVRPWFRTSLREVEMDGLAFVREKVGTVPMPMAELFAFELLAADAGEVRGRASPSHVHYNPFDVAQGGFAGTVLDIALGLVAISVLAGDESGVGTMDISITYTRAITEATGTMTVDASVIHRGRTIVVAEATLRDSEHRLYARARSTSLISR